MVIFFNRKLKQCFLIVFLCLALFANAQDLSKYSSKQIKQFEQVRQMYNNRNFNSALLNINKLTTKNPDFIEAYLLKSDILHEMNRFEDEISCYQQILKQDSERFPRIYFLMGNAQRQIGKYQNAKISYTRFCELPNKFSTLKEQALKSINACDFAIQQLKNPVSFLPLALSDSINTYLDEYWPSLSIDGKTLVFTRLVTTVDSSSGHKFSQEDFFMSKLKNGKWTKALPLKSLNTPDNEGAQAVSPDARLLFFTACSRYDSRGRCDIYFSAKNGEEWLHAQNVGNPVNSSSWEAQPSVSGNNEFLYFVSNRPGGKGGMDIWRCRLLSVDGVNIKLGKAENLGDSINTPGNEMSPFMHPDGKTLYFSSDYWQGMGGSDIFYAKMDTDQIWSSPVNLGYPINTYRDERGLVVSADGTQAFYSSNSGESMDIYSFNMPKKDRPLPVTYAQGIVLNKETGEPIEAVIELVRMDASKKIITINTDKNGCFFIGLPLGCNYMLNVSSSGYLFYSDHFALQHIKTVGDPFLLKIKLQPIESGKRVVLKNIFYETASWKLLSESVVELNKLIDFMNNNPSLKIEIGGHTDNVGGEQYNMVLSQNRAKSVYEFLLEAGINKERLSYRGYGYTIPVETNETGKGRAANRRTEFKIIE